MLEIGAKLSNLAELWKLRTGSNPYKFVRKHREKKRERFLTDEEFRRFGDVLSELEAEKTLPVYAVAAFRLLMLTGCRRNEIVTLKLGARGSEVRRASPAGLQDRCAPGAVVAVGGAGIGGATAHRRQPLGDSRLQAEPASCRSQPLLGPSARAGGASGRADS